MRFLFNILVVSLLMVVVSCEKQEQVGNDSSSTGEISITLTSAKMENIGGTKSIGTLPNEGDGAGYKVKDYWILQYAPDGSFIGEAKYVEVVEGEDYKTPILMPSGENKYYCLFIANTHNPELNVEFADYMGSLASMTKFYKSISSLEDTYNVDEQDLVMSGIAVLNSTDTQLTCSLYRNIAKLTVKLTNKEGSDLTIKSITVRNVPGGVLYADRLANEESLPGVTAATAPFPDSYTLPYTDYELDNISLAPASSGEYVWYLPRNLKGVVESVPSADLKNKYAPELATYIEVFALTSSNEPIKYKFYLGANAVTDFNVEPNKHYTLPISFIDKGSVLDSRIDDYGVVQLSGTANTYIINPLPIDNQAIYKLPIGRVNEFWGSSDAQAGVDNLISSTTEWVAEVIWQDQPQRVINFIDNDGNRADMFQMTGEAPISFEVLKGAKGNVLVGIRKASETNYLWSWHLWVTDYNPDECASMSWVDNKYVYYVTGGQVHRYAGDYWNSNYVNKYMMDRNLGALSAKRADGLSMTGGFLYQYGRKDPIPQCSWKVYNINGEEKTFSGDPENPMVVEPGPVPIYQSVYAPYKFYGVASGDWAADNPHTSVGYSWNGGYGEKSIFDPCPDGWMIPKVEVWNIFGSGTDVNMNANSVMRATDNAGVEFYIDAPFGAAHQEYNISYFPAMGIRKVSDGLSENYKLRGYVHSTQPSASSYTNLSLDFVLQGGESVKVSPSSASSRSKGLSVRCIRK